MSSLSSESKSSSSPSSSSSTWTKTATTTTKSQIKFPYRASIDSAIKSRVNKITELHSYRLLLRCINGHHVKLRVLNYSDDGLMNVRTITERRLLRTLSRCKEAWRQSVSSPPPHLVVYTVLWYAHWNCLRISAQYTDKNSIC